MAAKLPKPAKRYFSGDVDVENAAINESDGFKKKSKPFETEVIAAEKWAKPFRAPKSDKKRMQQLKIDREAISRHSRGTGPSDDGIKTNFYKQKIKRNEVYQGFSTEQAARTEILRVEEEGFVICLFSFDIVLIKLIINYRFLGIL